MNQKLTPLRSLMEQRGIDLYIVPTSDFHASEYVLDYFQSRIWLTGFTGDAGTAVVTQNQAGLWTDGRFFIQAESELDGSGFELFRMGQEGVPTIEEFVESVLPEGGVIGFDGRVVMSRFGASMESIAQKKNGRVNGSEDLVDAIWSDRPALASKQVFYLDEKYAGEAPASKLSRIRNAMQEKNADVHVLSSLDDIAWVLNVRGNDIPSVPVILSYLYITKTEAEWYVDESCIPASVKERLLLEGVTLHPYASIFDRASSTKDESRVLLDTSRVNYTLCGCFSKTISIVDAADPSVLMKAVKNETEIRNTVEAHIVDGIAVTRFMHWLKENIGKQLITEVSAADVLEQYRREQENFVELSFATISAYQANAAMMHYDPEVGGNAVLKPEGFLLVDSGGHYLTGSTDITRTFALGPLTDEMKKHFTLVVKGNLNMANAKFLYGCTGINLDILCRKPLWDLGIDYQCGTGHGVGYLLCVHEGPNGIRWKFRPGSNCVLEPGMITTDEPGVYLAGQYGIRIENELLCVPDEKNFYGQFLRFENITVCPIDLDAIDTAYLSANDRRELNAYHEYVYQTLAPRMKPEELSWLREYTRPV